MTVAPDSGDEGKRGDLEFGTIPGLLHIARQRHAGRAAIEDGDVTVTYDGLADRVTRTLRALLAVGLAHGERVAIWAPNMWEWIVAALATHAAGAVLVPINTRFKAEEAAYVLAKSGARVLFTVNGFLGNDYVTLLRGAGTPLPLLEHTIVLRGEAPPGAVSLREFLAGGERVSADEYETRAESVQPGDLSDIIFTSGTTGHPKGVMCTHAQTLRAFRDWSDIVGLRQGDRYLVVLPFFHSFGYKAGWLASLGNVNSRPRYPYR